MNTQKPPLNVYFLTMIIAGTILSIKNWPFMVEYGFSSLIYLLLAAALFFIPVSLVSAELASGWPEKGGIYVWIKEALGPKAGFLAVWLQWISNVIWFPTILSFISSSIAFAFAPELAQQPLYNVGVMLFLFWSILLINLCGIRYSGWFSALTLILGTLLPGALIILFGAIWLSSGNPSQIDFSFHSLIPKEAHINELIFLVGVLLSFAGMEMNAIHAKEVENPRKNFPKAIFLSAFVIVSLTIIGTFSVGIVIPKEKINLVTASMEAVSYYLDAYHLNWALPLFSLMVAFGACGGVSSWLIGTSKGMLHVAEMGHLPSFFSKMNRKGAPVAILVLQGVIVSILAGVFFAMPSLSSAFWILTVLSSQLYLIAYAMMFISAFLLRLKRPDVIRDYAIPYGKMGIAFVGGIGLLTAIFSFFIGFIPPAQMHVGDFFFYEAFLLGGILLCTSIPLLLQRKKAILAT